MEKLKQASVAITRGTKDLPRQAENKIGRGMTKPLVHIGLEVDNFQVLLLKESRAIAEYITENFTEESARFNNMAAVKDIFNTQLTTAMFSVAYWLRDEDFDTVDNLVSKEDITRVKVHPLFEDLIDKIINVLDIQYPTLSGNRDVKQHLLNTYKLLRITERSPYQLPLTLDDFKVLRKFVRNNIRPVKPAGDLSMHSIDARSALLQEIRKFNPFYAQIKSELDTILIDSRFRSYVVNLVGDEKEIKNLKRLISKVTNVRVEVLQKEDKKIYIKTNKECLEVNIKSYIKK